MALPAPQLEKVNGIWVVRDDLIAGGTKRRVIHRLLQGGKEFVYASPAYGHAQLALAYACREADYQATVFVAQRKELHPLTQQAQKLGAKIVQVPMGYLSNLQAKARNYCEQTGAVLLPFGMASPEMEKGLMEVAHHLPIDPLEVWSVYGSGTLTRALQKAWPNAPVFAIRVGADSPVGRAKVLRAPEKFDRPAKYPPPFPSCITYDAKAWRFVLESARPGALYWNVAK